MKMLAKPHEIRDLAVLGGYNSPMNSAVLADEIQTLQAALAERDGRIEVLEFELAKLKQLIFGARSERLATLPDPAQSKLWEEQADDLPLASPVEFKTVVKSPAKGQAKRTALPEHLPREIVVLPLSAEERACPACGEERPVIGYESSERLDYIPAQLKVVETRREKCACATCQGQLSTAPAPAQVIEQGIPLPGLLAYVLMAKFGYHLPLYRIEQVFAHQGVPIARTTLCDWVLQCGVALKPLTERLLVLLKQQAVIFSDDTTVAVQDRGKTRETRFWVYAGHSPPMVIYDHTETRAGKHPKDKLAGYRGYLQADAYAGYDQVFTDGKIVEVACWAHARRKFFEIARQAETGKRISAHEALDFIGQLYAIEQEAKALELDSDGIRDWRQEKARPVLAQFKDWLEERLRELTPKSPTAKAIGYALKNWQALERYTEDGRLEIDNNRSERAIRPLAIGRKNWIFLGSPRGGQAAATVFSLIQTCKELGLNPEAYLKDVLTRLPTTKQKDIDSLLPHNWNPVGA
jgi:transposase